MSHKIRVLVVDDSAFARFAIAKRISSDPEIEVVGHARDGIEALDLTRSLQPSVITMDVTMPRMDGMDAVEKIMKECPTPIVMVSALTTEGAQVTIRSLELGAVDFFCKPSVVSPVGSRESAEELIAKIKTAAGIDRSRLLSMAKPSHKIDTPQSVKAARPKKQPASVQRKVVVVGASTGGPRALTDIIPQLPGDIAAAILVVQHMPEGFTKTLAERLDSLSELDVKEAERGDVIRPGIVLFAPGGRHMTIDAEGKINLNQGPLECGLRPAANITMECAVDVYGSAVLGVVLTGMGNDATRGCGLVKKAGGQVIVQHKSTCVVYGMPKAVVEAGFADAILPLPKIPEEIVKRCQVFSEMPAGV